MRAILNITHEFRGTLTGPADALLLLGQETVSALAVRCYPTSSVPSDG